MTSMLGSFQLIMVFLLDFSFHQFKIHKLQKFGIISDKNGDLLSQFKNKKAEYKNYAYYYSSPADVLNSMKDVMRHYNIDVSFIIN